MSIAAYFLLSFGNQFPLMNWNTFLFFLFAEAMKNMQKKKAEWMQQGHGEYSEIPEEKEFFNITKNSQNVVCHFYREETFRYHLY